MFYYLLSLISPQELRRIEVEAAKVLSEQTKRAINFADNDPVKLANHLVVITEAVEFRLYKHIQKKTYRD